MMKNSAYKVHQKRGMRGVSLITVMAGIAISAIALNAAINYASNTLKAAQKVTRMGELEDIRRHIRILMDCPKTMAHASNPGNVLLYDAHDRPIMKANTQKVMKLGKWDVTVINEPGKPGQFRVSAKNGAYMDDDLYSIAIPLACPTS